jgi:prepilin-type N-terminal cleavage/methylation domain-containing protein
MISQASRNRQGFTLIKLLIVVAIIAILAAIAVPDFLEAQTRAKVSRCKSDMRTLATAIEAYTVDFNIGPSHAGNGAGGVWMP